MTTKKERREALQRMTKAELVKTIIALDARQTKMLNDIVTLQARVVELQKPNDWKPKLEAVQSAIQRHFVAPWDTAAQLPMPSPMDGEKS